MIGFKQVLEKINWSSIASIAFILIHAIVFLVLTQLISTTSFGIYALSSSIILFPISIIENSFPNSLIHTKNPSQEDYNVVFTINLGLAFCFIFIIAILLLYLTIFTSFTNYLTVVILLPCIILSASNSVHYARLKKRLEFKALAQIEMTSSIVFIIIVLLLAYLGFDYWSLILGLLSKYFLVFIILKKRDNPSFILKHVTPKTNTHWQYGKYIIYEKSLSAILSYADTFIVAHFLGMSTLGIYDVLKKIILRPIILLYNGLEQVFFSLFSEEANNHKVFLRLVNHLNFFLKFFFIHILSLIFLAAPFINAFFPSSFENDHQLIQLLAVFSLFILIFNPLDIIMYSKGKTRQFYKWQISFSIPLLITIFVSAQNGLECMLVSICAFYLILYILSFYFIFRSAKISAKIYFEPFLYGILLLGIMASLSYLFSDELLVLILTTITLISFSAYALIKRIQIK